MPFVRWLVSFVLALGVLSSSVMAWAAAGVVGDTDCCCPDKTKCKCHDHGKRPNPAPVMKKCGGPAELVAPAVELALLAAPIAIPTAPEHCTIVPRAPMQLPDDWSLVPDRPPF